MINPKLEKKDVFTTNEARKIIAEKLKYPIADKVSVSHVTLYFQFLYSKNNCKYWQKK